MKLFTIEKITCHLAYFPPICFAFQVFVFVSGNLRYVIHCLVDSMHVLCDRYFRNFISVTYIWYTQCGLEVVNVKHFVEVTKYMEQCCLQ